MIEVNKWRKAYYFWASEKGDPKEVKPMKYISTVGWNNFLYKKTVEDTIYIGETWECQTKEGDTERYTFRIPFDEECDMSEVTIQKVTKDVLSTKSELTHIGSLLLLKGVSYPMASAFLHFCHKIKYPIIDYRALWTLGYDELPKYNINFWLLYVNFTRDLANRHNLNMRTLDRALWGYSKKYQI